MQQLIALGMLFIGSAANAVTYNITALETLSGSGNSKAYALNDNGMIVGQSYNANATEPRMESMVVCFGSWCIGLVPQTQGHCLIQHTDTW